MKRFLALFLFFPAAFCEAQCWNEPTTEFLKKGEDGGKAFVKRLLDEFDFPRVLYFNEDVYLGTVEKFEG